MIICIVVGVKSIIVFHRQQCIVFVVMVYFDLVVIVVSIDIDVDGVVT